MKRQRYKLICQLRSIRDRAYNSNSSTILENLINAFPDVESVSISGTWTIYVEVLMTYGNIYIDKDIHCQVCLKRLINKMYVDARNSLLNK